MDGLTDAKLEICLLGRFSIRIGGYEIPASTIEGRKARSLLKLIALQRNHQIVRDRAMDLLWTSLSPDSAAGQLYKALHHIRKAFSTVAGDDSFEDAVEIADDVVRLRGTVSTDVRQFEEASRSALKVPEIRDLEYAASLYTGDLLPMDLYSPWTAVPRDHLRQLYLDVMLALGERYQRSNRLAHAAETFRLVLEKDPLLESAHRSLMRLFALQGQTTRAARQYIKCRRVLKAELDAQPEPETDELHQAIQERRIAGRSGRSEPLRTLALTPLVDRLDECSRIEDALERLTSIGGGVLTIEGPVGVGKTRLAQELASRARRRRFRALSGTSREMEGAVVYGPFIEILDAAVRDTVEAGYLIPSEMARSIPGHTGTSQPVPNTDRKAAQMYLFAQIGQFFRKLATTAPTVLVIEDLHASDEGTIELFSYLSRRAADLSILMVGTFRTDTGKSSERARRIVDDLSRDSDVTAISLDPLGDKDHYALLEQISDPLELSRELAESVYRFSEGNPLFAVEIYRHFSQSQSLAAIPVAAGAHPTAEISAIPSSLLSTVTQQLEEISSSARHLLYLLTILGRDVEFDLLAAAWRMSGHETDEEATSQNFFDLLDELTAARLVEEHGLKFRFRHALVRAAIYQSISEVRRIALHAIAARTLLEVGPSDLDAPVEQIAFHFRFAGDGPQAAHYLMLAGDRAESVYAHEEALHCYGDALTVLEGEDDSVARRRRSNLYRAIGDVYRASGRLEQSYQAYERALNLARSLHLSRSDQVELHLSIALVAIFRTELDRSKDHLDAASALIEEGEHDHARLLILRALHLWHMNRLQEAYDIALIALDIAESVEAPRIAAQACEILAMTCLPMGRWEEGLRYEQRRQVHGWSPDVVVATDAHLCLWEYHVTGERPFEEASNFMRMVSEQASRLGDFRCVAVCHYALGTMHLWRGDSSRAGDELDASLELHQRVGSPAGMAYALARIGVLHTMQGALNSGWDAVCKGIDHAQHAAIRDHCLQRLYGVGLWNRLEANEAQQASSLVADSQQLMRESHPCSACALEFFPWLTFYYLQEGNLVQAEYCSASLSDIADSTSNPIALIISTMVQSSLYAARHNHDAAEELRRKSLALVERSMSGHTISPVTHFLDRMIDQQSVLG